MKLNNIIRQALYEEANSTLKVFYSTDIFLRRTEVQERPEETEKPEKPEGAQEESTKETKEGLNEETFRTKAEGIIEVENSEAKTILTLNDLLAFINRNRSNGKEIINDVVVEAIHASIDPNRAEELKELIWKNDKINATIDYGFEKENSVGLQLNKNMGVDEISLIMRMDGKSTGPLNKEIFNQKIMKVLLPEIK